MSKDSFSAREIASFIDSDEVSSIDGIKLTKSKSYTHLVPERDKEREMRRTSSYTGSALLRPTISEHKSDKDKRLRNRARSHERSEDDDASESSVGELIREVKSSKREKRKHTKVDRKSEDDLLALPIRDPSLVNKLLPKKAVRLSASVSEHSSNVSEESSYEVSKSEGGTIHRRRKKKSKSMSQRRRRSDKSEKSQDESSSKDHKSKDKPKEEKVVDKKPDVSDKQQEAIERSKKPHTKEEIEALTDGFFLVPRFDWYTLEPGSCIKWVNKHGRCTKKEWYCWYQKVSKVTGGNFFYVGQYPNKKDNYAQMKMAVFWDNIKYLYKKEDPGTKLLRQAIDKRQDYINDLAIFLRNKYGEEFEKYMNRRGEVRRQKLSEQQALEKAKLADRQKQDAIKLEKLRAADAKREKELTEAESESTKKESKTKPSETKKGTLKKQRSAKLKKVASEKKIAKPSVAKKPVKSVPPKPVIKTGVKKIVNSFKKKPSSGN